MQEQTNNELMAKRLSLSENQIKILEFFNVKGPATLEIAYIALGLNKKTAGHHIKRLENFGFLKTIPALDGRLKPRVLSPLGIEILNLGKGERLQDEETRFKLLALEIGSIVKKSNIDKIKKEKSILNKSDIDRITLDKSKIDHLVNELKKIYEDSNRKRKDDQVEVA